MTIAIDLDTHLASNLTALAQQGVANTNNFAHYANLAFTKDDVPPRAIALEPAETDPLSASQAQAFLEGFNGQMLRQAKRLWAVAVPIVVGYDGDVRAGENVAGQQF